MNVASEQFTTKRAIICSFIVLFVCLLGAALLMYGVEPVCANDSARTALSIFATALGVLAGGCSAAFFAFEYRNAEVHEKIAVRMIAWFLIISVFLLIFLSMYCLRKTGAFAFMDNWALALLFVATFLFLDSIVLLERWDSTWADEDSEEND